MSRSCVRKGNGSAPRWLAALLLGTSALAQTGSYPQAGCRLYIRVVNRYGRVLPYALDHFMNAKGESDLLPRFTGLVGDDLPPGHYRYQLSRRDAPVPQLQITGEVDLSAPEQWLTVVPTGSVAIDRGGRVGAIDLGGAAPRKPIAGRIRPAPDSAMPTWVRCQALFTKDYIEVPVTADGSFSVPGGVSGAYLLIVMQGEHVLQTQEASFGLPNSPAAVDIVLPSRNGGDGR